MSSPTQAHGPTDPAAAPDSTATNSGATLTDEQLEKVAGGTVRATVRTVLGQSPAFASLGPGTQHTIEPDLPPVGDK
jgi:hypothetical protein